METEYYHQIARKYFRGTALPAEEIQLNDWLLVSEENRQLFASWQAEWHRQARTEVSQKTSAAFAEMQRKVSSPRLDNTPQFSRRIWYSIAAVALLVVGVALWLMRPAEAEKPLYASGEKTNSALTDHSDTSRMICTEEKQDICTPKGQMQAVSLPDGSVVMMSEETSVEYDFRGTQRQVLFAGKAEFEVAKDAARPFVVRVDEYSVTVLGTHFTLSARPGEWLYTISLQEGAVKLGYKTDTIQMLPGETVRFYPKTEKFMYDINGMLGGILKNLEPVYHIRFVLWDTDLENEPVAFTVETGTTVDEILDALCTLLPIDIQQNGNTYFVSHK